MLVFSRLPSFFFLSLCDVINPYNFSFHLLLTVFILALFHILWEDNKFKHLCRLIYLTEKTIATWKLLKFWDIVGLPLRAISFVFFAVNTLFYFSNRGWEARYHGLVEFYELASTCILLKIMSCMSIYVTVIQLWAGALCWNHRRVWSLCACCVASLVFTWSIEVRLFYY